MGKLDREIATYDRHLPELLAQQGKFVLIKGDEIAGIFDSYQDALGVGHQRFKQALFLVRRITAPGPLDADPGSSRQRSLLDYAGTGREPWARNSRRALRKLRYEWNR